MGRKEEGGRGYRGATREVGRWAREDRCRGERSVERGRSKGLSTREAGRGHATPHMPVETAKCWWLLKIEPSLSPKPPQK